MDKVYKCIIFDADGTLTTTKSGATFRKSADDWQWLPGRLEKLRELDSQGVILAIATNQGGVAFGYLDYEEIYHELGEAAREANIRYVAMSPFHPDGTIEQYRIDKNHWRKPGPGMLLSAMKQYGIQPQDTLMVGDRYEDMNAAKAAGVDFLSAIQFFGDEIDPTRDYAEEGTVVYPGYVSPYEFQRDEKHF